MEIDVVGIRKSTNLGLMADLGKNLTPSGIHEEYGMTVRTGSDQNLVAKLARALDQLPNNLVRACGIKDIGFEDLGVSKEYYPNHGYYVGDTLVLNTRLVDDPVLFKDPATGRTLDRFDHTLFHELGHGWDMEQGELSNIDEWLELSGWSEEPKEGTVRVVIDDKDSEEELVGEWYYDPASEFVRFYARRNPWDDFADTFAFKVAGLDGFLPSSKAKYFDDRMGSYYE